LRQRVGKIGMRTGGVLCPGIRWGALFGGGIKALNDEERGGRLTRIFKVGYLCKWGGFLLILSQGETEEEPKENFNQSASLIIYKKRKEKTKTD